MGRRLPRLCLEQVSCVDSSTELGWGLSVSCGEAADNRDDIRLDRDWRVSRLSASVSSGLG
jgi:hypothetical protein